MLKSGFFFKKLGTLLNISIRNTSTYLFYVGCVCIQDQSINNAKNDTMKLSVNDAKLTGL